MDTPRMTKHAQQRCIEMGIGTKRAKQVVLSRSCTYPNNRGHSNNGVLVHSASDPEIAVVWDPDTNCILTVLPRVRENYKRTADGFEVLS